jgi:nucleoside-diphosphate-sugar epimerase
MKILITGGAGYVGSSLIPLFLAEGYFVRVFDNLTFGGDAILPFFRHQAFEFIHGDIRNTQQIKDAAENCDIIIHLAAMVGYPACERNPEMAKQVNVQGTRNIVNVTSGDQIVIFASTGSNYGSSIEICNEETPLRPSSVYGLTKTEAERIILDGPLPIVFRFATGFGISFRQRFDLLINDFVYQAITEGTISVYEKHYKRSFIHVHDMGLAFVFALKNIDLMIGKIYNVGAEEMNFTKQQICQLIEQRTSCRIKYIDVGEDKDKRNYYVSYKKISDLGYSTTISVEQGISELSRAMAAISSSKLLT